MNYNIRGKCKSCGGDIGIFFDNKTFDQNDAKSIEKMRNMRLCFMCLMTVCKNEKK
jgi:hypothetical protein